MRKIINKYDVYQFFVNRSDLSFDFR